MAFWVVLLLALAARYVLQQAVLSRWLLYALPGLDVVLLLLTVLDVQRGATPAFAHGLAAAYVGFTVAFGPLAIRWADSKFAQHYFGRASAPQSPLYGWPGVRSDIKLWARCVFAWAIALALIGALMAMVGNEAAQPLLLWYRVAFASVVLWFIFGPVWSIELLSWRRR